MSGVIQRPEPLSTVIGIDGMVITAAGIEAFDCPVCQQPTDLITPECLDGHTDCPDRACSRCGLALSLSWSVDPPATGVHRRGAA